MARRKRTPPPPSANGAPPPSEPLTPRTDLAEPGEHNPRYFLVPAWTAGVRVTEDTALTYGAVWACVRVITEALAALPLRVYQRRPGGGRDENPDHPADWLLHVQANPETPAFQFRETLLAWALTWGNGYAEVERDAAGRPVWLWQLTPDRVCPERDGGRLVYEVRNPQGPPTVLPADDVIHLRGLGFDGLVGYSVISLAARSIGCGIAADQATASYFANDSTPGGYLKHPHRLSDPARKNLRESWGRTHGGPSNRRTLAILEEGMEWQQTGLPPEDGQLIQTRQYGPTDVCRWFKVPPHKIADLSRATFSNIEQQEIEFVIDCLMPWAVRLEQELNVKLFGRNQRGAQFIKHSFNARLRGDAQARAGFYATLYDRGVFSTNDIRELEDMNPVGPDGDKRFVPANMQLLENAGEQPEPLAPPPPPRGGLRLEFKEEDHPRDDSGRFSPAGGGGSAAEAKPLEEHKIDDFLQESGLAGVRDRLDETQRGHLNGYQGNSFALNAYNRETSPAYSRREVEQTRSIDAAVEKGGRTDRPLTVFRGVDSEQFARQVVKGAEFTDHAHVSTSLSRSYAKEFFGAGAPGNVMLEIRLPSGTRGAALSSGGNASFAHEKEFLLGRGSRFRVVSVADTAGGGKHAVVDYLGSTPRPLPEPRAKASAALAAAGGRPREDRYRYAADSEVVWQRPEAAARAGWNGAALAVLTDAVTRSLRREANETRRALKKHRAPEAFASWSAEFLAAQEGYAREALAPGVRLVCELCGAPAAVGPACSAATSFYVGEMLARFQGNAGDVEAWESRSPVLAARVLEIAAGVALSYGVATNG